MSNKKNHEENVWFEDADVDVVMLFNIFNTNVFDAEEIENGVFVNKGLDIPISILIDDHSGVLKLSAKMQLRENFEKGEILGFLDHINENTSCSSFYLHVDEDGNEFISGSAFIIYHIGMSLRLLYSSVIAFSSSFVDGCRTDEDGDFFNLSDLPANVKNLM